MSFLRVFVLERPRFEPCHLPAYSPSLDPGLGPAGDDAPCLGSLEALDADVFSGLIRGYHPLGFSPLLYPKSAEITKAPAPGQTETPFLLGESTELLILISNKLQREYSNATLSIAISGAGELLAQLSKSFPSVPPQFQTSVMCSVSFTSPKLQAGDEISLQVVLEMPGENGSSGVLEEVKRKIPLSAPAIVEGGSHAQSDPARITALVGDSLTVSFPAPAVPDGGAGQQMVPSEAEDSRIHLLSEGDSYVAGATAQQLVITGRMGSPVQVESVIVPSSTGQPKWHVQSRDVMKDVSVAVPFVYSLNISINERFEGENNTSHLMITSATSDSPDLVALDRFPLQLTLQGGKADAQLTLVATKPGVHSLTSLTIVDGETQFPLSDIVMVRAE